MKTTPWSLALVAAAGSAVATQVEEDCEESSAPAYGASSAVGGWGSASAPAGYPSSYPAGSSVYPVSSAYPSSYGGYGSYSSAVYSSAFPESSSGYASYSYGSVSAIPSASGPYCVTTYTSTCEETETLIYRSTTDYSLTTITHTLTTSKPGECPAGSTPGSYPSYSSVYASESYPGSYPSGSAPAGYPSGGVPGWGSSAGAYPSASAPAGYPSGGVPGGYSSAGAYPSGSAPAGYPSGGDGGAPSGAVVTVTKTNTKTVCPCGDTATAEPTRTPGEVYTTETITEYTTTCPGTGHEKTYTWGDWTSLYTSYEISTITDTITKTVTEPYPVSSADGYGSSPAGYPSGGAGYSSVYVSYSSGDGPYSSGPAGYPSASGSWPAGYSSGAGAYSSGYVSYSSGDGAFSSAYPSASGSWPAGYSSGAGAYSSGYASYSSGAAAVSSSAYPSASGSWPAGYSSGAGAYSSGYASYSSGAGAGSSGYPSYSASASYSVSYSASASYSASGIWPSGSGYATGTQPSSPTGTGCIPCEGQPGNDPEKWCGLDIHTNWYAEKPKTCKTREFFFDITAETVSPDGVDRLGLIVNGQLPGPMIEANWGDTIVVHVTNGMSNDLHNGTSLHFHGIRQNGTNEMDGVSSITQCPIAPGQSMTYKWEANSYGSSWWHSHYSLQTYEGVFGPMIIHGPVQDGYEYDGEQMIIVQDWNHETVDSLYMPSQDVTSPTSGPQTLDTGLINGMNVWENGGQRFEMTVDPNKTYRLRLVNTAIQSTFVFYVDGHTFSVIAMDFVPIVPYETDKVVINIGQRYDLIMKADQAPGDYWMRSDNQPTCGNLTNSYDIKGIVHYSNGPNGIPTSQSAPYPPTCLDEPYEKLVPIVPWSAGAQDVGEDYDVLIAPQGGNPNLFKWTLNGDTFYQNWEAPTLKSILDDGTVPQDTGNPMIEVPNLGEWVYVIIETKIPLPHPIHLHGHDFLILAQGTGVYNPGVALNLDSPPRRDVAVMPADPTTGTPGYLVVAFYTSNPGVWLMHCHIGWHNAMGFALQIIENLDGIKDTISDQSGIDSMCASWTDYANAYDVFASSEWDSGV